MNYFYMAILALGAFVAIWMIFVVPAERRHHERKLELVRQKIERRKEEPAAADSAAPDNKGGDSS